MKIKIIPLGIVFLLFSCFAYGQVSVSLKKVIELSHNNQFYQAEKQNIDIAQTDVSTAQLKTNPSFNVEAQQITSQKYFPENTGVISPINQQVLYQLSKPFKVAGQRKYNIQLAKANVDLVKANLAYFENSVINEAVQQWINVWYASKKEDIIRDAKTNSDTLVKICRIRLKDQAITSTEFSRTQIMDEQYKLMLVNAQQELRSQSDNLKYLLGINDSLLIDETGLQSFEIPEIFDTLMNYSMQNRTDLRICKQTIEKARIEIMLQQALAKPQPEVGLGFSRQNQVPYLSLSVTVPLPVYDRNQGEIAKANLEVQQAEKTAEATIAKIKSEVQIVFNEYVTNKSTFEKYHEIYNQSEDVLKTVKFSYLRGGTTIVDYLEAERNWFDLQNQYFYAMYNYRKSLLDLLIVSNLIKKI